jgi:ubiquinone biosynthesis UbiH/UbiF/VisC/COQ6 family hydroxylase
VPSFPSLRVSAVTPRSAAFFESVGAWRGVRERRATPYREMQVWETFGRGRLHWRASELARDGVLPPGHESALGYIVENEVMQAALTEALRRLSEAPECNVELAAPARIERVHIPTASEAEWPRVALASGETVRARLLVAADGANSLVARAAGARRWGVDYEQRAVVATVRVERPHATAWQRFLPGGPLAMLPCHESFSSLVWSTSAEHAAWLCAPDATRSRVPDAVNAAFASAGEAFHARSLFRQPLPSPLAELLPVLFPEPPDPLPPRALELMEPPRAFPLRAAHVASLAAAPRVALVGDAAHVVHPLAGQGLNLGLRDAEELARAVARAVELGQDLGAEPVLRAFACARERETLAAVAAIDSLQRLFSVRDGPVALARAVGLDLFNATPALKNAAARAAVGFGP